uniref:Uncharacterized protein n=1 Tax=Picea glauca TaxID=3330 RepID=A0A101LUP7_PICGL|nr:hypothetical protein ABT39_MTgene2539 [Picea glauca]
MEWIGLGRLRFNHVYMGFDLGLQQAMPLMHLYLYLPLGKVMVKLLKLTKQQLDMLPSLPMHPLLSLMMVDQAALSDIKKRE